MNSLPRSCRLGRPSKKQDALDQAVGVPHLIDGLVVLDLAEALHAPVIQHARMQEVLIDRSELVLQRLIQIIQNFCVALHGTSSRQRRGAGIVCPIDRRRQTRRSRAVRRGRSDAGGQTRAVRRTGGQNTGGQTHGRSDGCGDRIREVGARLLARPLIVVAKSQRVGQGAAGLRKALAAARPKSRLAAQVREARRAAFHRGSNVAVRHGFAYADDHGAIVNANANDCQ